MKMNDKLYSVLKWLCIIALPAIASFYYMIAEIWKLPYSDEVPRTITGIATLIGALIGVSALSYNENKPTEMNIDEEGEDEEQE